ncbi:MAG: hypothetical protein ACSHX3_13940 [Litorimonas sp.]
MQKTRFRNIKRRLLAFSLIFLSGCAVSAQLESDEKPQALINHHIKKNSVICSGVQYDRAKAELQSILAEDQDNRANPTASTREEDAKRRETVSETFAKSCLRDSEDYFIAAVVYQHGHLPEHYLQAVMFSNTSTRLDSLMAIGIRTAAIDRYLMSVGHNQVFATQVIGTELQGPNTEPVDGTPCLWPVEQDVDVRDYEVLGPADFREHLSQQISARRAEVEECDLSTKTSSQLLQSLLSLSIDI